MHTQAWRYPRTTPPEADGLHMDWGGETPHRPRSGGAGALGKKLWQNAGLIVGLHYFLIYATLITIMLTAIPTIVVAQCDPNDPSYGLNCTANQVPGLKPGGSSTPQQQINLLIGTIIKTILGLTGVIFMIMIVTAGDLWMTAGGNEEKISKARTMIFNAAVGILIVFGAYIVTDFIVGIVIEGIGGG